MKCTNCGFITKGKEKCCPYCGEPYGKVSILDKQINILGWFYLSLKTLLFIIATNLFLVELVVEVILKYAAHMDLHIYPFAYVGIYLLLLIVETILLGKERKRFIFAKASGIILGFSILSPISYRFGEFMNTGISVWQLNFGYLYPIGFAVIMLSAMIYYFVSKRFDILYISFGALSVLGLSSIFFGVSYIPYFAINELPLSRIINIVCFALIALISINAFVLCIFRFYSKVHRK